MKTVDISRERIEHLHEMGCADYIHLAMLDYIDELRAENARLSEQCAGMYQSAWNNGQALLIAESRLEKVTTVNNNSVKSERARCAQVAYRVCAETRHVTLGNKVYAAIIGEGEDLTHGC